MDCYTVQIPKFKQLNPVGIELIDITVKSGWLAFAPTWPMVMGIKNNHITTESYTAEYTSMMRQSWHTNRAQWLALFEYDAIALGCYCQRDTFCHRYLLKDMLEKVALQCGYTFDYRGELCQ